MKELTPEQIVRIVETVERILDNDHKTPFMVIAVTDDGSMSIATNLPLEKFEAFKFAVAATFAGMTNMEAEMTDLTEQRKQYNEQNVPESIRRRAEGDNPTPLV